ncbi:MAG TPA: LiaF-related protein [Bacteroidia bacterium]|nr:LiaF-related protein [Bacteroidia bacterium]
MSSAVFWGVLIILFGLSIILKEVFHINFPFLRVIFGIFLIIWGIKVISGSSWKNKNENTAIFSSANMSYENSKKEYNIVFGRGDIDLFKSEMPDRNRKIEVNVVFGNGNLIINDSIPTRVEMNSVFGNVRTDKDKASGFGSATYTTGTYNPNEPHYKIEANAVFGNLVIDNRKW